MTDPRHAALDAVDSALAQLEALNDPGPTWSATNGGWTTASRADWIKHFGDIRSRLLEGDDSFDYEGHHLARLLNHDGIIQGAIAEAAATLQLHLRELSVGG